MSFKLIRRPLEGAGTQYYEDGTSLDIEFSPPIKESDRFLMSKLVELGLMMVPVIGPALVRIAICDRYGDQYK